VRDYLRLMIVLALISAIAGGLLAFVDSFTAPQIEEYKQLAEANAYRDALPQADTFESLPPDQLVRIQKNPETSGVLDVKIAKKAGSAVGWVCKVASHGYSSDIKLLVGIGNDARLGGVLILEQSETPGLGAKVTESEFIGQSAIKAAKPGREIRVSKDGGEVQAIAGATISSRAVLRGINQAFKFYQLQALPPR
jgi:electron transport complex protein RnfG